MIYISNWRTLSQNIATRFGFKSYEDIDEKIIDIDIYNRIVCQIDSLHWINYATRVMDGELLIIYDEFCSILSHIHSMADWGE